MNSDKVITSLRRCEDELRLGRVDLARVTLLAIGASSIPRKELATAADLARRLGAWDLGLRLLKPVVRPVELKRDATEAEMCVYAALLIKVGATAEALAILAETKDAAVRHLYAAFAHQSRWDYRAAIPSLEAYLEASEPTPYQRTTALVNLAAACVYVEDFARADRLLEDILVRTRENDWGLLAAGALEIKASTAIHRRDWTLAETLLSETESRVSGRTNVTLFAQKWHALLPLLRDGNSPGARARVAGLRDSAARQGHWETVRDCDFYVACATGDPAAFAHVYFGTPYPSYRARIANARPPGLELPATYVREGQGGAARTLDVSSGRDLRGGALKAGQKPHRLLAALARDFYRPALVGAVAAEVFPGEFFDRDHTPKRIFALLTRLRTWVSEQELEIAVVAERGTYRIDLPGETGLRLDGESITIPTSYRVNELADAFGGRAFTADDAAKSLGLSLRSVHAILNEGVASGRLLRTGRARRTRYRSAA